MIASVNVDMDTLNDYAYTYGKNYAKFPDPIYTIALPRLLRLLDKHKIKATFFVIGRDLNINEHYKAIKNIQKKGHEIANHTQSHLHNFERLSFKKQKDEIINCHQLVKKKLGLSMVGFRAPGYNLNKGTFKVLSRLNYLYDSSSFPTFLLPLLKLAIIVKSKGNNKSTGGGDIKNLFSKTSVYLVEDHNLLEIPITVTPILRLPFMGTFNVIAGKKILKLNYQQIKLFRTPINYEIHPIEFLEFKKDKLPSIFKNHPGVKIPTDKKLEIYDTLLLMMKKDYKIYTLANFAKCYL